MTIAEVILPLPVKSVFTYRVREEHAAGMVPGKRVLVTFGGKAKGGKIYTGVVKSVTKVGGETLDLPVDASGLRDIEEVLDETPALTERQLALFTWMAFYYVCTEGEVVKAALPTGLKPESALRVRTGPLAVDVAAAQLVDKDYLLLEALSIQPVMNFEEVASLWDVVNPMPRLKAMQARGLVEVYQEVEERYKPKFKKYLRIATEHQNEAAMHEILDGLARAPQQENLFMHLISAFHRGQPVPKDEALKQLNLGSNVAKQLMVKGFIVEDEVQVDRLDLYGYDAPLRQVTLTPGQDRVLAQIRQAWQEDQGIPVAEGLEVTGATPSTPSRTSGAEGAKKPYRPALIHGVTGSGKTHLYIELIREMLATGKQVLYLLPEITLTKQIVDKVKMAFGDRVGIYHSKFNDHERVEIWHKVRDGDYQVVVGVRSAIFLPFPDLGMIVVDEEHDSSFKQQEPSPRYNARDVAVWMGVTLNIPIVLGSATPSFESYQNALKGKYLLVELHERAVAANMPLVYLVNMLEHYKRRTTFGPFSADLYHAIGETVQRGEQVILFQNRRGYSPYLSCTTCGHVPMCVNCDISLTFHKEKNLLRCHYCGHTEYKTQQCGVCNNFTMQPKGLGTERIEEQVKELFPHFTVERMDLDTTRTKFGYQHLINRFEAGEIQILVGTQMVSKGLDFENVTLVGVMNADNLLTFPDFRASESAYQLLTQVSGRAGRSTKHGRVFIQTSMPDSPVLQAVNKPYRQFYDLEIPVRGQLGYPPFTRVVRIETSHPDRETVEKETLRLDHILKPHFGTNLLGPDYALVARVRNQYRMQFLLKVGKTIPSRLLREAFTQAIQTYYTQAPHKTLRITLDVDPM